MDDGVKQIIEAKRAQMGYKSADEILGSLGLSNKKTVDFVVATDLARRFVPEAIMALVDIVNNGEDERARIVAATALLDRAYGKAVQAVDLNAKSEVKVTVSWATESRLSYQSQPAEVIENEAPPALEPPKAQNSPDYMHKPVSDAKEPWRPSKPDVVLDAEIKQFVEAGKPIGKPK